MARPPAIFKAMRDVHFSMVFPGILKRWSQPERVYPSKTFRNPSGMLVSVNITAFWSC
jgi:hypothetical protein